MLIAGATASGKSALALHLAERDRGVVINADASQVYRCWRVLTARPDEADMSRAPHRLYGHVDCRLRYSVGAWLRDVAVALDVARGSGLRPIIVGGTGLYFTALTEGLADIPDVPPEVRARSDAYLAAGDLTQMLAALARHDPETFARIDRNNPRRVQRAWDVLIGTGRGIAAWHATAARPLLPASDTVHFVAAPAIHNNNMNIERRVRAMLEHGVLDECRTFLEQNLDPSLPATRVLGAAPLCSYLRAECSLEAAVSATVTQTRQFAKRQRTWFRNRMPKWPRVDPQGEGAWASVPSE